MKVQPAQGGVGVSAGPVRLWPGLPSRVAVLPAVPSCNHSPVWACFPGRGGGGRREWPAVLHSPGLDLIPDSSPGEACVCHPSPDWDRNGDKILLGPGPAAPSPSCPSIAPSVCHAWNRLCWVPWTSCWRGPGQCWPGTWPLSRPSLVASGCQREENLIFTRLIVLEQYF